jgi:plasmid stability protein
MASAFTIRVDMELKTELQVRADLEGKTVSEVVREILLQALSTEPLEPLGSRIGHLKGQLVPPARESDSWHQEIRDRNWRS